jgi:hypothetical protein
MRPPDSRGLAFGPFINDMSEMRPMSETRLESGAHSTEFGSPLSGPLNPLGSGYCIRVA